GLKKMQASLKNVDCIIEVHDARIPLSGRNPVFEEALGVRPHLLVLNKLDLADLTNKQIVPAVTELIQKSDRFHRAENLEYCLMVIGVPNVGKSSLINAMRRMYLRKGKASRVGGEPGVTRAVLTKIQMCLRPLVVASGTILDHLVGEEVIADYLLFTLNKQQKFDYVERYQLGEPCDDLPTVLKKIAIKLGKTQKVKAITGVGNVNILMPNYSAAAYDFIRTFRKGELGKIMLD
ncbi:hypothetical protein scyTo_0006659, partial [Scyliorhinus torazame]|nr:hypothetical protein [Scyliorhinus torazame]